MYFGGRCTQSAMSRRRALVSAGAISSVTSATPPMAARARSSSAPLPTSDEHSATLPPPAERRQLPREVVRHEPDVARAHHVHLPASAEAGEVLQERGEGGGLERVGPRRGARQGGAEEEERRHNQVEVAGEGTHLRRPLPRRGQARSRVSAPPPVAPAAPKKRRRRGRGGPKVDGGVGIDGGGGRAEAGGDEHAPEHGVEHGHHAEPHRSLSLLMEDGR
jgi:hypothetical protein